MRRLSVTLYGRVQGVGFRAFCVRQASALGLKGYVKNKPDRSVHVLAVGTQRSLELFLRQLMDGPPRARVDDADVSWSESSGDEPSTFTVYHH